MSRIRTIKPDLFRHEELFEAERTSGLPLRLAFAGLFTVADREGRFKWRPRALKIDVLPYDDIDFAAVLDALESAGFIAAYEVDDERYGHIPKWAKHQHVNMREQASTLPSPDDARASTCAHVGKGREGEREEEDTRSLRSRESRAPERELDPPAESLPPGPPEPALRIEFDMRFWPEWPHKVGRPAALRAFIAKRQTASLAEIMDGLARYKSDRPPDRQWLNPATFLNDERFRDDPAPAPVPNGSRPNGHDAIFRALAEQASGPPRQRERDAGPDGHDDAERGRAAADFDARGAVQIEADAER